MSRLRTRLARVLAIWAVAAAADGVLYYFFLSRPYFRAFFLPLAAVVLLAAAFDTWRVLRGRRDADRRSRERRVRRRRADAGGDEAAL